jgi:hypothetical protein
MNSLLSLRLSRPDRTTARELQIFQDFILELAEVSSEKGLDGLLARIGERTAQASIFDLPGIRSPIRDHESSCVTLMRAVNDFIESKGPNFQFRSLVTNLEGPASMDIGNGLMVHIQAIKDPENPEVTNVVLLSAYVAGVQVELFFLDASSISLRPDGSAYSIADHCWMRWPTSVRHLISYNQPEENAPGKICGDGQSPASDLNKLAQEASVLILTAACNYYGLNKKAENNAHNPCWARVRSKHGLVGEVIKIIEGCNRGAALPDNWLEDPYLLKAVVFLMYRGYIFPKEATAGLLSLFLDSPLMNPAKGDDARGIPVADRQQVALAQQQQQTSKKFEELRSQASLASSANPHRLNDLLHAAYLLRGGSFKELIEDCARGDTSAYLSSRYFFGLFFSEGSNHLDPKYLKPLIQLLCQQETPETIIHLNSLIAEEACKIPMEELVVPPVIAPAL